MARMSFTDTALDEKLGKLEGDFRRQVTEKVLYAGAKVLIKKMQNAIQENHHVVSGDMMRSVDMSEIHTDIDESYVEVATMGDDSRGVSNAMKNKIINYGYFNKGTGAKHKKDPYLKKLQKDAASRVHSVMAYQFQLTMEELGLTEK